MRKGFTLIEIVLVLALAVAFSIIAFANLSQRKVDNNLTATVQQVATLLQQAQSDSMAQENDVSWGVYFSNVTSTSPFYALFTTSYSTSTVVSGPYRLPSTVAFRTSTLASGATTSIIFSSISGTASVSTSIGFYSPQNTTLSSTIYIASSGIATY